MKREVDYTSTDQFNKHFFPKSFERGRLEKMSIKERAEYEVSQMMNKMRKVLKEGK